MERKRNRDRQQRFKPDPRCEDRPDRLEDCLTYPEWRLAIQEYHRHSNICVPVLDLIERLLKYRKANAAQIARKSVDRMMRSQRDRKSHVATTRVTGPET